MWSCVAIFGSLVSKSCSLGIGCCSLMVFFPIYGCPPKICVTCVTFQQIRALCDIPAELNETLQYLLIEVNVLDLGIDCVHNDSKDVPNHILCIFAIIEFKLPDDLNAAPSECGLEYTCFQVLCDCRNFVIHPTDVQVKDSRGISEVGNSRGKGNPWGLWVRVLEGKGRGSRSVTPDPSLYPWLFLVSSRCSPVGWGWGSHWTGEA